MAHLRSILGRGIAGAALAGALAVGAAAPVAAHAHVVTVRDPASVTGYRDQVLANDQRHAPFVNGVSCGGDPAAYGLESAHHGPDAGTPGKADGCYQTTGFLAPGVDVTNPVIH